MLLSQVAIKAFHQAEEVSFDSREIDILLKHSNHKHIVHFYGQLVKDYSSSTCRGYVMEFMATGCLDRVIHNATISYGRKQVISWMRQISLGLGHLHGNGIIHRDIKPKNLLLGETLDVLKISDFGTARFIGPSAKNSLTGGRGTSAYMAPEVIQQVPGEEKYSYSADIYSLAITLWEIFRRKEPYPCINAPFHFFTKVLGGERPPLGSSPISDEFDHLIQRGWNEILSNRPRVSAYLEYAKSSITSPNTSESEISRPVDKINTQHFPKLSTEILVNSKSSVSPPPNIPPLVSDYLEYAKSSGTNDAQQVPRLRSDQMDQSQAFPAQPVYIPFDPKTPMFGWNQMTYDAVPRPKSNKRRSTSTMETLLLKYPFLAGVEDADFVIEILEMFMSDEEMSREMRRLLPAEQFEQYKQWKIMGELLNMISDIEIREKVRDILGMEGSTSEKATMIRALDEGAYRRFQYRKAAARPPIQPNKPLPQLSHRIKVPADRVVGIKWLRVFDRLKKNENHQCDVNTTNDNGTQVITLKGEPTKVLDAALEIWRIMAKEMTYSENLAPWLADMVSRIWDRQKRLSFLNKQLVELWIGEENGVKFARLNAWTYDELQTAKGQLSEDYRKIPAKKIHPVIQIDPSKYPNEINILVLGQSRVGKTTFINSVANYLIHKTMKESLRGNLKILINFYASTTDDTGREQDVLIESTVGDPTSENERFGVAFQGLSNWRFEASRGVGDTSGVERAKEIMNENMAHLANFPYLNAILILMNPDENRLSFTMKYCIKELFVRLHTSVSQNILFCFPKTGGYPNFQEQRSRTTLQALVTEIGMDSGVQIPLTMDTKFTFENLGFKVRCQCEKAVQSMFYKPNEYLMKLAHSSWKHSAAETARLFRMILSLPPNNVQDHVNINAVRETVAALARPMVEVSKNQLMNQQTMVGKRNEIRMFENEAEGLKGRLHVKATMLRTLPLDHPQTVCTSRKCVEFKRVGEFEQSIHKTVCHTNCKLRGIQEEAVNNPAIKNCAVFYAHGINRCSNEQCGCDWTMHQHVRWMLETYEETVINREIEGGIHNATESKARAEMLLKDLVVKEQEYKDNCTKLIETGAMFAVFLKKNCISSFNDAFKGYLQLSMRQEEEKVNHNGTSRVLLDELRKYKEKYEQQVRLFTEDAENGSVPQKNVTEVLQLIEELKQNPRYGHFIRTAQGLETDNCRQNAKENEIHVDYEKPFTFMYD